MIRFLKKFFHRIDMKIEKKIGTFVGLPYKEGEDKFVSAERLYLFIEKIYMPCSRFINKITFGIYGKFEKRLSYWLDKHEEDITLSAHSLKSSIIQGLEFLSVKCDEFEKKADALLKEKNLISYIHIK